MPSMPLIERVTVSPLNTLIAIVCLTLSPFAAALSRDNRRSSLALALTIRHFRHSVFAIRH